MFGGMRIPEGSPNEIPININFPAPPPVPVMRPNVEEQQVVEVAPQFGFGSLRKPSL